MRRIVIYQLQESVYRKRATVLSSDEVIGDENLAQTVRDHMIRLKENQGLEGKALEQRILRSFSNGYLMARFDDEEARKERASAPKVPELSETSEDVRLHRAGGEEFVVPKGTIEQQPLYDDDPAAMDAEGTSRFGKLIKRVWHLHERFQGNDSAIAPSAPILFFGDLNAYLASELRVLTVAKNPSDKEFPEKQPFVRFPALEIDEHPDIVRYKYALSRYFEEEPYDSWFDSWGPILEGLDCGFNRDDLPNTALHTDLCSPLATSPPWSQLDADTQSALMADGIPLWHDLIDVLQPNIIIFSFGRDLLDHVDLDLVNPWNDLYQPIGKRAKTEMAVATRDGSRSLLVFGTHAQKPFGHFSTEERREVGRRIARERIAT